MEHNLVVGNEFYAFMDDLQRLSIFGRKTDRFPEPFRNIGSWGNVTEYKTKVTFYRIEGVRLSGKTPSGIPIGQFIFSPREMKIYLAIEGTYDNYWKAIKSAQDFPTDPNYNYWQDANGNMKYTADDLKTLTPADLFESAAGITSSGRVYMELVNLADALTPTEAKQIANVLVLQMTTGISSAIPSFALALEDEMFGKFDGVDVNVSATASTDRGMPPVLVALLGMAANQSPVIDLGGTAPSAPSSGVEKKREDINGLFEHLCADDSQLYARNVLIEDTFSKRMKSDVCFFGPAEFDADPARGYGSSLPAKKVAALEAFPVFSTEILHAAAMDEYEKTGVKMGVIADEMNLSNCLWKTTNAVQQLGKYSPEATTALATGRLFSDLSLIPTLNLITTMAHSPEANLALSVEDESFKSATKSMVIEAIVSRASRGIGEFSSEGEGSIDPYIAPSLTAIGNSISSGELDISKLDDDKMLTKVLDSSVERERDKVRAFALPGTLRKFLLITKNIIKKAKV